MRPSLRQPVLYEEVNCVATLHLLEAAVAHGAPRFLFASSSSVYGTNSKLPFSEEDPIERPISPYATTKRAGELHVYATHHLHGLQAACLRFFTVYGPRQRPEMAIARFIRCLETDEPIPFFGDGGSRRDYTYIDDIVDGVEAALDVRLRLRDPQPRRRAPGDADGARRGARGGHGQAAHASPATAGPAGRRARDVRRRSRRQSVCWAIGPGWPSREGLRRVGGLVSEPARMNICMVGTGYVGLVTGACLADFGMNVVCVDKDAEKIAALQRGEIPIYEPGLDDLVSRNERAGRLRFTTDLKGSIEDALAIFIAVGTPPRPDGSPDLTFVQQVADAIAEHMNGYKVVVTKSTVPTGTGKMIEQIIRQKNGRHEFSVVSNPEFLREGSAVSDFLRPDRIIIGASDPARDRDHARDLRAALPDRDARS